MPVPRVSSRFFDPLVSVIRRPYRPGFLPRGDDVFEPLFDRRIRRLPPGRRSKTIIRRRRPARDLLPPRDDVIANFAGAPSDAPNNKW